MTEDYLIQEFHEAGIYLEEEQAEIDQIKKLNEHRLFQAPVRFAPQPQVEHAMFGI